MTYTAVKLVDNIPWQTDDFEDVVVGLIRKECGAKPVLILNDMTDQHFKGGQRLPKVGLMDRGSVLKRKLQVAFPNYPIRGALPVKAKPSGDGGVRMSGGLYLFAAVPVSEQVVKTLEAVKRSMVSISGFALLPVESSDMVKAMSEKLAGKKGEAARWTVFIGQHHSGGLRQVITRDGQLAMTRMTPVADLASDPNGWAREASQEFKATLSYLSRFGYSPEDSTDVIVVAHPDAGRALEQQIEAKCNYTSYTVSEAARLLGMKIGIQDDPHFAEPLHVAWAGRKSRFILPMEAADIDRIHKPRQIAAAAMFLLIAGGAYLGWQLAGDAQRMMETKSDLESQRTVLARVDSEYQQEVQRMEALGIDVDLIQGVLKTYQDFELDRVDLMALVQNIGEALGDGMRIDTFVVEHIDEQQRSGRNNKADEEEKKPAQVEARMALSFPPDADLEEGTKEVNNLRSRLAGLMPEYDVIVTRQVGSQEYTQNIKGVVTSTAEEIAAQQDLIAELVVRGPKQ
ncbi:MAG: hypothetical protein H6869_06065 [Rhodospirillales bacterium]|nr:hypothetical protein [Rhodospirillales bacterium]